MVADPVVPVALTESMAGRAADEVGGLDGTAWVRRVPDIVESCLDEWRLVRDGEPMTGRHALVLPVRRGRERLALKVGWPRAASQHEHLALRAWRGVGAVRLVAAQPSLGALLLERSEPADELKALSALDAAEVVGTIHARLRHSALPQLATTSAWCGRLLEYLDSAPAHLPKRLVQHGQSLCRDFLSEPAIDAQLVHTNLHDGNVMRAERANTVGGYVAIAPTPMAGDPASTLAPLLWTRWDEVDQAYNVRNHLRFRLDYASEPMGVDVGRARAWSIVRLLAAARDADATRISRIIVMIKAMEG